MPAGLDTQRSPGHQCVALREIFVRLTGRSGSSSEDFRVRWARHDVGTHDAGIKRLHHPLVGRLELTYEGMTLAADPDLVMFAFTAEVGSKSEEALNLLASWAATPDQQATGEPHDRR
jgi:hypothetical protein